MEQVEQERRRKISLSLLGNKRNFGKKQSAYMTNCKICDLEFETTPSRARKYCSKKCTYIGVAKTKSEQQKGKTPYWMNTPEAIEKMRQTKLGKPSPKKGMIFPHLRGANSASWKGGNAKERELLMRRPEYRGWRDEVFRRDNYTCQMCDQYGGYLHADHIKGWSKYPKLRFEVSNGRTLCVPCHYYITFKKKMAVGTLWCNYRMTKKVG